ncbi:O-methyltransferase [Sinomicrobium oceani]|uniref:O-methyltransferase n=1 Tax=Sinomicrobium oceani TaxID=1150368 RepID=UPI00227C06B7|nr:O-methyltransferase [Sinomicrobium oceani]
MHFISEILENYVENHTQDEPELLKELDRETHLKVLRPRMLSGHFQGRLLSLISKLKSPRYILEIGTYTGYSAICMAEGLREDGELHTIDINEELHDLQRRYFDRSGFGDRIIQHTGNALDIIPTFDTGFDLVFIDADKENYQEYFDLVITKMNPGGLILSDNVLWSGKVVEPVKPNDKSTMALLEYNEKLKNDPRVETILLPVRDGLTICRVM